MASAVGIKAQTHDVARATPGNFTGSGVIQKLPLNEFATYSVGISAELPTTIMLPSPPQSMEGVGFTTSENVANKVQLQHRPGSNWFSVRALFPEAEADLNIVLSGKIYSFHFFLTENPHRSLTLFDPASAPKPRKTKRGTITVKRLLEILDDSKSYLAVRELLPDLYRPIEFRAPGEITPYRDFQVITDQVFRFPSDDTIVFRIIFNNTASEPLRYDPKSIGVRVRNSPVVYWHSISDLSGYVPPATTETLPDGSSRIRPGQAFGYFAITGNPDGSRANLSLENSFDVLVRRARDYDDQPTNDISVGDTASPAPSPSAAITHSRDGNPPAALSGELQAQPYGSGVAGRPARSAAQETDS